MKHFLCIIFLLIWRIRRFQIDAIKFERTQIHFLVSLICTPLHYLNTWNRLCFRRLWVLKSLWRTYYLPFIPRLFRASIKPGTRNFPEHAGTFRKLQEHPGTEKNIKNCREKNNNDDKIIFVKINNNVKWNQKKKEGNKEIKKKKLVSSTSIRKQYFVANNLLGEWGSMQMTVISEGLLLNSKCVVPENILPPPPPRKGSDFPGGMGGQFA